MLTFENVSKSYWTGTQHKVILDDVSFKVEPGNSLGILAPNGTGKTTLINMIAGLEKPDEGEIRRECKISFPLGFMGGVVNKISAMENARYIARLYGLDPDYVESFCRWLCNLEEYFDQPLGTYSAGMRARFSFSLMLALDFDMYLIDEGMPSTTDAEFNRKAGEILQERLRTTRSSSTRVTGPTGPAWRRWCRNSLPRLVCRSLPGWSSPDSIDRARPCKRSSPRSSRRVPR